MRDYTYPTIIAAAKTGFRALGQRITLTGTEHVPRTGGVLLACNHISYVDFVYAGLGAHPSRRLVRFMAKKELFDHRFSGPLMRSMHHIEVDRGAGEGSLRTALDYLRRGEAVGIFPEATISRAFVLKEFKTGAVRIAADAGVPLLPVVVWGTHRMVTKDHPRDFSRGRSLSVSVGEPMLPDGSDPVAQTAALKEQMAQLLDRAIRSYPAAEQPPGSWWLPAAYGGSAPTLEQAAQLDAAELAARARRRAEREARGGGTPAG